METEHNRIREIYLQACELEPGEPRRVFLSQVCGADSALRQKLDQMLELAPAASAFFAALEEGGEQTVLLGLEATGGEGPGSVIGHYKLLEEIGHGGFGAVYMAEQMEPVHRRVALKIIKLGMDTREVIARFEAERQALALMDHPGVARVLDAGATSSGRPYFVMDLVRGLPVTEFCDRNRLSTRERIELFIGICHAVQHAHSKGIIHRDLKPSNILVTMQDGRPLPKIIDFGIAKAVQKPLTDKTLFTRFGQMIGTPVYMSPEHLGGADIDTRSDVYSLGVILYELLTGKQPFDLQQLRKAGHREMIRVIEEEDPPPPSTRLTRLGDELAVVAQHRHANPRRLGELIRGDLDWITMKALQKNRAHRYGTPLALGEDLQRHLEHQPVSAGPPHLGYRSLKFVRRHRYAVAAAAGIFLSLVIGLLCVTYALLRVREERTRAVLAERAAEQQRQIALAEAQRSRLQEAQARRISYTSDMALASHALAVGNLGRAAGLLQRHVARSGAEDLRDWEWRYLRQQCQSDELFQLARHSNSVFSLALSADGRLAAVGDLEGTMAVYDVPARALLWSSNSGPMMAFSPDGKVLLDSSRVLRDAESGLVLGRLDGEGGIKKAAFSPDGQLLAALTGRDCLSVWQRDGWKPLVSVPGYPYGNVHYGGPVFTDGAEAMLFGDDSGMVLRVRVRDGQLLGRWKAHDESVTAIAISPNFQLLATGAGYSDTEIRLWRVADGRPEGALKGHNAWVSCLAFSPEGELMASASADQSICLWDVLTRKLRARLRGHLQEVWFVAFAPDGKSLVSGAKDGSLKVWRVPPEKGAVGEGLFSPRRFESSLLRNFAFTPDGKEILGTDVKGVVWRWALPSLRLMGSLSELGESNCLLASAPALHLVAVLKDNGTVCIWDLQKQCVSGTWLLAPTPNQVDWIGFVPGKRSLASVLGRSQVQQWDVDTGKRLGSWTCAESITGPVSLSPDGLYLATGSRYLNVFSLSNGCTVARLAAHKPATDAVAFSPDGKLLASGSQDGLAKLWRVGDWREVCTLRGHLLGVHSLAFSPDGRRLATGSVGNEAVKLWDLSTRQEVLNVAAKGEITWWLSFSPDGQSLLRFGAAGDLRCWWAPLLAASAEERQPE